MGAYDRERINETIPLLRYANQCTPRWVSFQTDDARLLRRIVYWLMTSRESPIEWGPGDNPSRKTVIQWRTSEGWTEDIRATPVVGETGRIGRLRFRTTRSKATSRSEKAA